MSIDELLLQVVGDDPHTLAPLLRQWMATSRRFRAFAEQYQTKIRSKLRSPTDRESLQDLLLELEIARWLLQEKRFQVIYEGLGLRNSPAPDFTVHFTTKTLFHVEVTRIHANTGEQESDARKVLYVILGKLGQLKAGASNLLMIGLASDRVASLTVAESMKYLKRQIELGDPALLARGQFATPAAFFKQYRALSGILFYTLPHSPPHSSLAVSATAATLLWLNPDAIYPLLPQIQTSLQQLLSNQP